jgi:hypothetical protein
MDVDYKMSFSHCGYAVKTRCEVTADCIIHNFFSLMLNSPNTDTDNQSELVGGGFKYVAAEKNYTVNQFDNSGIFISNPQNAVVFCNSEYAVLANFTTVQNVPEEYNYSYSNGSSYSLIQDRIDDTVKIYTRAFNANETLGVEVKAGDIFENSKVYRVVKSNIKPLIGL